MNRESDRLDRQTRPLFIVISGPSGVGKSAVIDALKKLGRPLHYAVTVTTRPRRAEEVDGVDYHFVSHEAFQEMLERREFLEWALVYGNKYGVPREQARQALQSGKDVLVRVDVQGSATIKALMPEALFIFLAPPSLDKLAERLKQRATESDMDLALRMENAQEEMRNLPMFDYVVVNEENCVELAASQIDAIITAEKCRVVPRVVEMRAEP